MPTASVILRPKKWQRHFYAKLVKSRMFLLYYDYICKIVLVASSNMEKKSDTYQIATDIQWEFAGEGIVRQIMAYDEHLMMVKVKFNQGATYNITYDCS